MSFQTVPVNVAGPSYQSRSRPLSSQSTVNFYQEFDESGKTPTVLHSWPGQTLFGSAGGIDRGIHVMSGLLYRVSGEKLYSVNSAGSHTEIGDIPGSDRCIFANDGESLFIVTGGVVYQYNSLSGVLSEVSDADIVGATAVDFLNNQFIYTKPNLFIVSDVGNGASASGLNAAQAESQPDDLLRAYVFDQIVYMFGEHTIEPWYNSGAGLPPFDRIDTQMMSIGLAAVHSVAHNDMFMYWLGDDRQIYQASGGAARRISSKAIAGAFEGYSSVSDAVAWTMTFQGQNFYIISVPSQGKTWALNESLGEKGWFELSHADAQYNVTSYSFYNGKHIAADQLNGNLYEIDIDAYDNNGEMIKRKRVMSSIHGGMVGQPGKRLQMSRFELILETGVGLISGQGEDPKIMIEASYDGGKSFEHGGWMRVGRLGETNVRAEWFSLKSFYDLIIRITTSDPVHYTILSGAIDLRTAGR